MKNSSERYSIDENELREFENRIVDGEINVLILYYCFEIIEEESNFYLFFVIKLVITDFFYR